MSEKFYERLDEVDHLVAENNQLRRENAVLRKDAARYQYLKLVFSDNLTAWRWCRLNDYPDDDVALWMNPDAAIDNIIATNKTTARPRRRVDR